MRGSVSFAAGTTPGRFVRAAGSDVAAGTTVLTAGVTLTPAAVALLASVGRREVQVGRRPVVAVVTTGDEVVRDGPLRPGQLRSSNHLALRGLIEESGAVALDAGHAPDDPAALRAVFDAAMGVADVVVSTGGVSAGTADLVRPTWAALGVTELLYKVRMKPGMPVLAGTATRGGRGVLLIGLPGNPVSTVVTFQQLVRPALRARMGDRAPFLGLIEAVAVEDLPSAAGRARFERVELVMGAGRPELRRPRDQSSHVLSGLATAAAFVLLGPDSPGLVAGEAAWVQPLGGLVPPRADPGFDW
jgi:molybdopterin molybdotransferase